MNPKMNIAKTTSSKKLPMDVMLVVVVPPQTALLLVYYPVLRLSSWVHIPTD